MATNISSQEALAFLEEMKAGRSSLCVFALTGGVSLLLVMRVASIHSIEGDQVEVHSGNNTLRFGLSKARFQLADEPDFAASLLDEMPTAYTRVLKVFSQTTTIVLGETVSVSKPGGSIQ